MEKSKQGKKTGQDVIFDFGSTPEQSMSAIDDLIVITVMSGKKGHKIGRISKNYLKDVDVKFWEGSEKVMKVQNFYMWFDGSIKSYSNLKGENVSLADKKIFLNLDANGKTKNAIPEGMVIKDAGPLPDGFEIAEGQTISQNDLIYTDEDLEAADEFYVCMDYTDQNIANWHGTPNKFQREWYCDEAYVEALEDNTILVCIEPKNEDEKDIWETKLVDVPVGHSVETLKQGDPCYLFVGGECTVTDTENNKEHTFNKWDCKKLTKSSYNLTNTGTKKFRACLIYKDV